MPGFSWASGTRPVLPSSLSAVISPLNLREVQRLVPCCKKSSARSFTKSCHSACSDWCSWPFDRCFGDDGVGQGAMRCDRGTNAFDVQYEGIPTSRFSSLNDRGICLFCESRPAAGRWPGEELRRVSLSVDSGKSAKKELMGTFSGTHPVALSISLGPLSVSAFSRPVSAWSEEADNHCMSDTHSHTSSENADDLSSVLRSKASVVESVLRKSGLWTGGSTPSKKYFEPPRLTLMCRPRIDLGPFSFQPFALVNPFQVSQLVLGLSGGTQWCWKYTSPEIAKQLPAGSDSPPIGAMGTTRPPGHSLGEEGPVPLIMPDSFCPPECTVLIALSGVIYSFLSGSLQVGVSHQKFRAAASTDGDVFIQGKFGPMHMILYRLQSPE